MIYLKQTINKGITNYEYRVKNVEEVFETIAYAIKDDKVEEMLETKVRDEGFKRLT